MALPLVNEYLRSAPVFIQWLQIFTHCPLPHSNTRSAIHDCLLVWVWPHQPKVPLRVGRLWEMPTVTIADYFGEWKGNLDSSHQKNKASWRMPTREYEAWLVSWCGLLHRGHRQLPKAFSSPFCSGFKTPSPRALCPSSRHQNHREHTWLTTRACGFWSMIDFLIPEVCSLLSPVVIYASNEIGLSDVEVNVFDCGYMLILYIDTLHLVPWDHQRWWRHLD